MCFGATDVGGAGGGDFSFLQGGGEPGGAGFMGGGAGALPMGGGAGTFTPPPFSVLPTGEGGTTPYGSVTGAPITSAPISDISSFLGGGGPYRADGGATAQYTPYGQAAPVAGTVVPPAASPTAGATAASIDPIGIGATTPTSVSPADLVASAQGASEGPGFFERMAKGVGQFRKDYQPLFDVAGLGLTGAGVLKQLTQPGGVEALSPLQQEELNMMRQQQQTAQQYMQGTVTPEMQQNLTNQTQAQITAIKDKYAKLGMSGSTAESQELAGVQARATAQLGQMQAQMIQTGAQMLRLPATMISGITAQQEAQLADFNKALAAFIAQMAGRPQDRPTP